MRLTLISIALLVAACRTESRPAYQAVAEPPPPAVASVDEPQQSTGIRVEAVDWLSETTWYDDVFRQFSGDELQCQVTECDADTIEFEFRATAAPSGVSSRVRLERVGNQLVASASSRWWKDFGPTNAPRSGTTDVEQGVVFVAQHEATLGLRFVLRTAGSGSPSTTSGGVHLTVERAAPFFEAGSAVHVEAARAKPIGRTSSRELWLVQPRAFAPRAIWYDDAFAHHVERDVFCTVVAADTGELAVELEGRVMGWRPPDSGVGVRFTFRLEGASATPSATTRWWSSAGEPREGDGTLDGGWIACEPKDAGMEVRFCLPTKWRE